MTDAAARTVATIVIASAGAAVAYVVLTAPPLRRLASRAFRVWLGASVPAYFVQQIRRAWVESGESPVVGQPDIMAR